MRYPIGVLGDTYRMFTAVCIEQVQAD